MSHAHNLAVSELLKQVQNRNRRLEELFTESARNNEALRRENTLLRAKLAKYEPEKEKHDGERTEDSAGRSTGVPGTDAGGPEEVPGL